MPRPDRWATPARLGDVRDGSRGSGLELTIHLRTTTPVPGPILGRFTTRTIHEGHLDETGQLWSTTGQLLAESRQLALLIELPPSKDG